MDLCAVDVAGRAIGKDSGGDSGTHRERHLRPRNKIGAFQRQVNILASRGDLVGNHAQNLHGQRVAEAAPETTVNVFDADSRVFPPTTMTTPRAPREAFGAMLICA